MKRHMTVSGDIGGDVMWFQGVKTNEEIEREKELAEATEECQQ